MLQNIENAVIKQCAPNSIVIEPDYVALYKAENVLWDGRLLLPEICSSVRARAPHGT